MDIRERKERLKDIISMIDKGIDYVEYDSMVIEEALEKIDDLFWYLEENCITPHSTNKDKLKGDVFINYFEDDSYIENIVNGIRSLTDDVEKYIDGMVEGRRKEAGPLDGGRPEAARHPIRPHGEQKTLNCSLAYTKAFPFGAAPAGACRAQPPEGWLLARR